MLLSFVFMSFCFFFFSFSLSLGGGPRARAVVEREGGGGMKSLRQGWPSAQRLDLTGAVASWQKRTFGLTGVALCPTLSIENIDVTFNKNSLFDKVVEVCYSGYSLTPYMRLTPICPGAVAPPRKG